MGVNAHGDNYSQFLSRLIIPFYFMKANVIFPIILVIIVTFSIGCVDKRSNDINKNTQTVTTLIVASNSLQPNTAFNGQGYTISIPSNWETKQEVSQSNWRNDLLILRDGKSVLMISRSPNPNPEQRLNDLVVSYKQKIINKGIKINEEKQITIDGSPAIRYIFKDDSSGIKYMQIITIKNNYGYIIQFSSWPNLFDEKISTIYDILNTFKFS